VAAPGVELELLHDEALDIHGPGAHKSKSCDRLRKTLSEVEYRSAKINSSGSDARDTWDLPAKARKKPDRSKREAAKTYQS
jgi:hypothetical protein